jgi:GTPase SAR1 family protein
VRTLPHEYLASVTFFQADNFTFLLFGDAGVGRSSLLNRMGKDVFVPVERSKELEKISDIPVSRARVRLHSMN